jgi:uncharacterized protein (DUF58 family)
MQYRPRVPEAPPAPVITGTRPGRVLLTAVGAYGAVTLALLFVLPVEILGEAAVAFAGLLALLAAADGALLARHWRRAPLRLTRRLPAAFAIGVRHDLLLTLQADAARSWQAVDLHDGADPSLRTQGLPALGLRVRAGKSVTLGYSLTPQRRGEVSFAPAQLRLRSRAALCELLVRTGTAESRRVYPDFAQVARYAWLAGDQRLAEIGIKSWRQRGEGTDFKQLAEYRVGDAVRHIDWKATLRNERPIIREYQDERDQNVILLIDCGRRMRADESQDSIGRTHFDQVLNAALLLAYVALRHGDAVGAMTFGTGTGGGRLLRPRKGTAALNELMAGLYDAQPTLAHSDYLGAATALLAQHRKRSLVIVITNFRDEDSTELGQALKLLRTRHLVLLASLREAVTQQIAAQALSSSLALVEVAASHLFAQARSTAFVRLAERDALMLDAEPARLAIELVNHYQAVKRAGLI